MMRPLVMAALVTVSLAGALPAAAQSSGGGKPAALPEPFVPPFALDVPGKDHMMAGGLGSAKVMDAHGEEVGDVEGVVLAEDGRVVALVVGLGGFLGLGERNVAVRYEHVSTQKAPDGSRQFRLALGREEIARAPRFRSGQK